MPEITSTRKTAFSHVSQVARAAFESLVTLSLPRAQRNAVTTLLAATFVIVQLQAHRVCNMGNSLQLNSLDDFDNFLPSLTGWAHHSNFARGK